MKKHSARRVEIKGLQFSLLDDAMLESRSVVAIGSEPTTSRGNRKSTGISTVFDPRFGSVTPGMLCSTCSNPPEICNGHLGHIDLCAPIIPALFLPYLTKILNSICISCGTLLLTLSEEKRTFLSAIPFKKRLTEVNNRSLKVRGPCHTCRFEQPVKWIIQEQILLRPVWPSSMIHPPLITPEHMCLLLSLVDAPTGSLFGFHSGTSPLSCLMLNLFPIPPILMRPNRSSRLEDDLSIRLRAIIQANLNLAKLPGQSLNLSLRSDLSEVVPTRVGWKPKHQRNKKTMAPEHLEEYFDLQRQTAGFQDSKYCTKNDLDYGRELASVRQRFQATKHRRGRIRANLLGKRGDYTARAVASPNTYIDPHEVGVPIRVCQHLTIRETVCAYNYQKLQYLVYQGPHRYPGANYVERNGDRFLLPLLCEDGLQMGDVVHRHLSRGDLVIMNRQPSLHRYSMMGYRVVPMDCTTFQLHLSVTSALNLDFDGDEVNLFVPGGIESTAEIRELLAVDRNLFKDGQLLVGFVQHACLAVYLLTNDPGMTLSTPTLQQLLYTAQFDGHSVQKGQTGREILRVLLPTYDGTYSMTKSTLNRMAGKFLSQSRWTTEAQVHWLGCLVRFLEEFLLLRGSTLCLSDCRSTRRPGTLLTEGLSLLSIEPDEEVAVRLTDALRAVVGNCVQADLEGRRTSNLLDIVESGAKGTRSHIIQNVGMVGQQFDVESKRQQELQSHDVPRAFRQGFIQSSFSDGLGPVEFFHHLTSARVGLIGTAVSTSETGYCYRRISKCLEDIRVGFDHSVRTASNELILLHGGFSTAHTYTSHLYSRPPQGTERELQQWQHRESLRRVEGTYLLPMDMDVLPTGDPGDVDSLPVTAEDVFGGVRALWDRLLFQWIPPEMEPFFFGCLSTENLRSKHRVGTQTHLARILRYVEEGLCRALHPPGTPIGLIVSQSFSEPLTQIQLNRFHHSGEGSGLVSGVSRIKEIINCMKQIQTPSMTIYALEGSSLETQSLVSVTLEMVLHSWTLARPGNVTLVLQRPRMLAHDITPRLVADAIGRKYKQVKYTKDLDSVHWEVWFPVATTTADQPEPIRVRTIVRSLLKSHLVIKGVPGILDFYLTSMSVPSCVDGQWVDRQRECLVTRGSNLLAVCQLPWVDLERTTTNDLMELYNEYGIDAVCVAIEQNLSDVMGSNDAIVSRPYLHLIAHEMCRTGIPCPLTFVGMQSSRTSTLKLATFERSLETFVRAARTGHTDRLRGVSEAVMVGKPVSHGTGGDFDVVYLQGHDRDSDIPKQPACIYPPIPCDITHNTQLPQVVLVPVKSAPTKRPRHTEAIVIDRVPKRVKREAESANPFLDAASLFVPYRAELR